MSLINYHHPANIQLCLPTPTFFNLTSYEEEQDDVVATTTQPYYKSRYYHHDLQQQQSSYVLGLPHHMLPQTVMEPLRDYKAMITPAPSEPVVVVPERKLYPKRQSRLSLTTKSSKRNKVKRVKFLFYQMLHIIFRAPTTSSSQQRQKMMI